MAYPPQPNAVQNINVGVKILPPKGCSFFIDETP